MDTGFQLLPHQASSFAKDVDNVYYFLLAVSTFFTLLIFVLIVYFGLKYRRQRHPVPVNVKTNYKLEFAWTIIPFCLTMVMFAWGAKIYVDIETPPVGAMEIHVTAKQWMWKLQHPEGQREINALHVPVDQPIKLVMASQDVIHSFYVPAFRVKHDVVPGRYNTMWFKPTRAGTYHLFCAEYCGAQHSGMIGTVHVMRPDDYQSWLAGTPADERPVRVGERLFVQHACNTCHGQRAPTLAGLYGRRVTFADGSSQIADDDYIRESILQPSNKIVAGYPPIMPTYQGLLTEEQTMALMAYLKTLKTTTTAPASQ